MPEALIQLEVQKANSDNMVTVLTSFGWTPLGESGSKVNAAAVCHIMVETHENKMLRIVENMGEKEECGVRPRETAPSQEDKRCLNSMEREITGMRNYSFDFLQCSTYSIICF